MDQVTMKKKKSNKHPLLYSLTAITCSIFCSIPFWFPSISNSSSIQSFLFVTLPNFTSMLLTTKLLFIIGNIIIVVLIGESKFLGSESSSSVYYDEYVNRSTTSITSTTMEASEVKKEESLGGISVENVVEEKVEILEEKSEDLSDGGDGIVVLPTEELNKRANDLIARVNRQRRLEARLLYGSE